MDTTPEPPADEPVEATAATAADPGSDAGGGAGPDHAADGDESSGGAPPDDAVPGGRPVPRTAVLVAALALVVVVVAVAVLRGGDDPDRSTSAAATSTTETTLAPREPGQILVATARTPELVVRSTPPEGWDERSVDVAPSSVPEPVASQASTPARPPLPRVGLSVEGRHAEPGGWRFENPTAFGEPFVMLVTEGRGEWLQVEVPVRPNGTAGWVRLADVDVSRHRARVEIDVDERRLRAWVGREQVADTAIVVGTDGTRTPTGRFYLTDEVSRPGNSFYGPWVLALNAYSEQLDEFEDGVPVIAIHGTNRPEQVGQAISNGCIRVPNDVITELRNELPLGTQVDIRA